MAYPRVDFYLSVLSNSYKIHIKYQNVIDSNNYNMKKFIRERVVPVRFKLCVQEEVKFLNLVTSWIQDGTAKCLKHWILFT